LSSRNPFSLDKPTLPYENVRESAGPTAGEAAVHHRDESTESRNGTPSRPAVGVRNVDEHLRLIIGHSPDLIVILDRDAKIRFINRTLPQFTVEGVLGTCGFEYCHGADRERYQQAFREVLLTGEPREVELVSDGPACWLARFVPVKTEGGEIDEVLVIATDVTERKRAEEERRRFEAQIQQSQRLESLGVLAGGIAHDFNNLLTGILGSASLAAMKVPADSPAAEQIARVLAAAERAADLTSKMLAYAGKGQFVLVPSDLNQIIEGVLPLVRTSLGKTTSIQLALAPNLPSIEADASQLQQVLVNLLTNAAEADAREIVVRSGAMAPSEHSPHPGVFLEVKDDGTGMDEPTRARIFEPFFTTKFTGRGLGLSAVAGIVSVHGGKIRVESAREEGTSFTVLFPTRTESS
jgi:PAS domain S-box-containing protein